MSDKWRYAAAGFLAGGLVALLIYYYKKARDREKALKYMRRVMEEGRIE